MITRKSYDPYFDEAFEHSLSLVIRNINIITLFGW